MYTLYVHKFIYWFTQSTVYPNRADPTVSSHSVLATSLSKHYIAQWLFTSCCSGTLKSILFLNKSSALCRSNKKKFFNLIVRRCSTPFEYKFHYLHWKIYSSCACVLDTLTKNCANSFYITNLTKNIKIKKKNEGHRRFCHLHRINESNSFISRRLNKFVFAIILRQRKMRIFIIQIHSIN